jgi:hypothetical protein
MKFIRSWTRAVSLIALAGLTTAFAVSRPAPTPPKEIMVWKSPSCGCCGKWVEYMKAQGYKVTVHDMEDVSPVKKQHSVPQNLWSCHTAVVDGYTIEGHVPAADIARLLRERPAGVTGLSVPGMVAGSPGMEGGRTNQYDVVAFGAGKTSVFAHH